MPSVAIRGLPSACGLRATWHSHAVGRLDDIVARNQHPGRHRKTRFPMGLVVAMFVLLVLVLMIFTDLGVTPEPAPPPDPPGEKRVRGVGLYSPRAVARDAASD
jgi:hypothetical protein